MKSILNIAKSKQRSWKLKLPLMIGTLYFFISTPFLLNLAIPSIHEGNLYSTIYVLINFPAIYLFGNFSAKICQFLFQTQSLYKSNLVFITMTWIFWVFVSFLIGMLFDFFANSKATGSA